MSNSNFAKSDIGAQAAWKGFSSQTLYIAYRLLMDDNGYEYYPEDVEDLVVKKADPLLKLFKLKIHLPTLHFQALLPLKHLKAEMAFLIVCVVYTL